MRELTEHATQRDSSTAQMASRRSVMWDNRETMHRARRYEDELYRAICAARR
jgi:hypothetical protein